MRVACLLLVAAALGAAGCASQDVIIHRMPPETPAADNANAIQRAAAAADAAHAALEAAREQFAAPSGEAGGAGGPPAGGQAPADQPPVQPLTPADAPPVRTYDPWERVNRWTYEFNARFDEAVFLPVSNGYRRVPSPVRSGVHHFFGNLSELDSIANYTLQGRLGRGVRSLGRFVINSTLGIGGVFDVATMLHLDNSPTGFGTTLAKWGMHPGAYVVIPFLGPSTVREAVGLLGDYGAAYGINLANLYRGNQGTALGGLNAVDQRANVGFRYYSSGSPFEYETIRFLYVRKLLLEDAGLHKRDRREPHAPDLPAGQ